MFDDKKTIKLLRNNLKGEFEAILFYLDNLSKLNYKSNKKEINPLVLDSFKHGKMLAQLILGLNKNTEGKVSNLAIKKALKEETGMKEIYKYEFNKIPDKKIKETMKKLIKEENGHEKLVKKIK